MAARFCLFDDGRPNFVPHDLLQTKKVGLRLIRQKRTGTYENERVPSGQCVGVGDCAHVLNTFVTGSNKTPTGVASNTSSFHATKKSIHIAPVNYDITC